MTRFWNWIRKGMGWLWCSGCSDAYTWDQWGGTLDERTVLKYWCRKCVIRGRYQA